MPRGGKPNKQTDKNKHICMTLSNTHTHFMVSVASLQGFLHGKLNCFSLVCSVRVNNHLWSHNHGLQAPHILIGSCLLGPSVRNLQGKWGFGRRWPWGPWQSSGGKCWGDINQALATSTEVPCSLLSCWTVEARASPIFHLVALQFL